MKPIIKVISTEFLTHDVIHLVTEKPANFNYIPGQAVEIAINKTGWETKSRPFTLTSLPGDDNLEFIIKTYPSHNGVTNELLEIKSGDELVAGSIFGEIEYKGEGLFIAGGAGITPFIPILNELKKNKSIGNNKLIFANKTKADIILKDKFEELLGENFINVLSEEKLPGYEYGFVTADIIKKHMNDSIRYFYVCGPKPMMELIEKYLLELGVSYTKIIKEAF